MASGRDAGRVAAMEPKPPRPDGMPVEAPIRFDAALVERAVLLAIERVH